MLLRTITFIAPCLPSLLTRNGHDWTGRFPLIAQAADALAVTSCLIDGEAVCCDDAGLAVFERLRQRRHDASVFLCAFDLIELDGKDLRRESLQVREAMLVSVLAKTGPASGSTSIWNTTTARRCFATPASSGSKASSRSGRIRLAPAARAIRSSSRNSSAPAVLVSASTRRGAGGRPHEPHRMQMFALGGLAPGVSETYPWRMAPAAQTAPPAKGNRSDRQPSAIRLAGYND